MAYIGTSPSNGVRRRFVYVATANQTSFSGNDENGISLVYVDVAYLDVYQNGVKLKSVDDYASTTGTTVVLVQGASADDVVEIIAFDVFSIGDTVSAADGGNFGGNVGMGGTLAVTGNTTVGGTLGVTGDSTFSNIAGGVVFNEASADVDFRVESNGNANMVFVDGGNDAVGIGNNTPASFFAGSTDLVVGSGAGARGITIFSAADATGNIKFADATTNDATKTAGGIRYDHTNNFMRFDTNDGSERLRIDSAGRILIGTTSAIGTCLIGTVFDGTNFNGIVLKTTRSANTGSNYAVFLNAAGAVTGNIQQNGTTSVSFGTSSDYRLKENVVTDWDATTRLKQLKPSRFNFIADADTTVDGFIAHEVSSIVPEAITGAKDAEDADGNAVMQCIDQSKLVPLLVKTIQELEARITALENA